MKFYCTSSKFFKKLLTTHLIILTFLGCSKEATEGAAPTLLTLTLIIEGQGSVNQLEEEYALNTSLSVKATPAAGYYFDRWKGFENDVLSEEHDFILTTNLTLTAVFLPIPQTTEEVALYIPKEIDPNPVFMIENGGTKAYLTSKTGERLQTWNFDSKLGNDIELLSDGSLIGLFKPDEVSFSFGGYGGILRKMSPEGTTLWEYELNTESELLHHDFEILPNGNILILVWEGFQAEVAQNLGYDDEGPMYLEKIIELNPETQKIEWEWRSVDHLIQDHAEDGLNFGEVAAHPKKIDLNYYPNDNGDLMHANGLYYDAEKDVIFLSVNFYSEVWVIPHQYDTETTATAAGDLLFRFGNPQAYGSASPRLFYNNHHPTLVSLDPDTAGRFLIYMNGSLDEQSIVYEFILPPNFDNDPEAWSSPEVSWSFTDPALYFGKISGAYRLPNGNTLICEGDYGYWEVTTAGKVVWKYQGDKNFWRGYVYP
ncbi:MAG: aryl-sulfate sulfotransferase [Flavobacteriaceae bacterium]